MARHDSLFTFGFEDQVAWAGHGVLEAGGVGADEGLIPGQPPTIGSHVVEEQS
jgi:hypothetical protein